MPLSSRLPMINFRLFLFASVVAISMSANVAVSQAETPSNANDSEVAERSATNEAALQLLQQQCGKCHGEQKTAGKLDVRNVPAMLRGGKRGPAVVPGDPSASNIVRFVQPGSKPHMPPGKKQLTEAQIALLTTWVAAMPMASTPDTLAVEVDTEPDPKDEALGGSIPDDIDPVTVIDLRIAIGWSERGVTPTQPCSDAEFVRRVYLDLAGRIPSRPEAEQFLASTDSRKRGLLVDELLGSADYAQHMANLFDVMLMGRATSNQFQQRQSHGWHEYLRATFHENRPWDKFASEVLLGRPASPRQRGPLWFLYERAGDHQKMAEAIAPNFFGIDIACAQCHDHPLAAEIEQRHYWGLVAFFKRTKNATGDHGIALAESAVGGFDEFADLSGSSQVAELTFFRSATVPEDRPAGTEEPEDSDLLYSLPNEGEPRQPKFSRREAFVKHILADHPLVARAMVNRVWGVLLGRGIVDPIDSMDSTHPPSHPHLLDWLSRDFARHNYDVKRLIRAIVASRAYQLTARTDPQAAPDAFSFAIEKPLTAEAYVRSIEVGLELKQSAGDELRQVFRELFPDVKPGAQQATLAQTMLLSNHSDFQSLISVGASNVQRQVSSDVDRRGLSWATIDYLFQSLFVRSPRDDELARLLDYIHQRGDRVDDSVRQIAWALVTSAEFRFNH